MNLLPHFPLTHGTCKAHGRIEQLCCNGDTGRPKISSTVKQICQQYGTYLGYLEDIIIYLWPWGSINHLFLNINVIIAAVNEISWYVRLAYV